MSEALSRTEMLSRVSMNDTSVFVHLARSRAELAKLDEDLAAQSSQLKGVTEAQAAETQDLQARFESVAAEYERLKRQLAASAPAPSVPPPSSSADLVLSSTDGMYCPVAGPTSFSDTWGAPRDGHTHQGVDMMGAYGTPLVAVTAGSITYAAYDGSGGNMIFLSGDDGNAYWYMHNQQNLVTGGHVSAGQQIATLGDTGNASGTPHLHFEYHPGGGAAVNPTPLVASLC
jgi:murein DD-endopeptidase MepM/ murein hydrolase activator NlpD